MKVFITNKAYFESIFKGNNPSYYKTSAQIHKDLFNKVKSDYETENVIEVLALIPYKDGGDALFQFVGKNKEMFFYEFLSTAS